MTAQKHQKVRRDLAATWTSINPVLYAGEYGYESDTTRYKVGDGVTAWNSLPYWSEIAQVKTISTTTYTLTQADNGFIILFTNAAGCTVTLPASGIVVGFITHLHQEGAGQVIVTAAGGVSTRTAIGLKTRTQYSSMSVMCILDDVFKVIGDLVA
jgi:Major tropism determinant N-terminal domain